MLLQDILPEDLFPPVSFSINERADEDMPYTEPEKPEVVTEAADKPLRVTAKTKAKTAKKESPERSDSSETAHASTQHSNDKVSSNGSKPLQQQGQPSSFGNGAVPKAADSDVGANR